MLTRRDALTGSAAALTVAATTTAALAAQDPDAALLATIADFNAAEASLVQLIYEAERLQGICSYLHHPDYRPAYEANCRRQTELLDRIQVTPAATPQGVLEKLRLYMTVDKIEGLDAGRSGTMGCIAASAFRDLERLAGRVQS